MTAARGSPVFFFSLALAFSYLSKISASLVLAACIPAALAIALGCWGASRLRLLAVCLLAASLGCTAAWIRFQSSAEMSGYWGIPPARVTGFKGRLIKDSGAGKRGDTLYRLQLTCVSSPDITAAARARVIVLVRGGEKMYLGQKLTIRGTLSPIEGPDRYLCRTMPSGINDDGSAGRLYELRSRLRRALSRRLETLTPPAAALTCALLFGEREALAPETVNRFRTSGSYHVLALSGLHVGILFMLISSLCFFLPGRNSSFLIGVLFMMVYLGLVGLRPSLIRAVLMLVAAAAGRVLDRDSEPLNSLALAAAVIMLSDPGAVYDLSFQLSFLSLLGILCFGPAISRMLIPHLPPLISLPLACSLGAQAASAPVLLAGFGAVYPIGIVASLVVIPMVTLCIWLGLLYLVFASLPLLGPVFAAALAQAAALLELVTDVCSRAPAWRVDWRLYSLILSAGCLLYSAGRRTARRCQGE
jgi:competence protein ComEC